jgi:hypothetical protein
MASWRLKVLPALLLMLLLAGLPSGTVQAGLGDGTRPHCEICRRYADHGPSRMEVSFTFGKRIVVKRTCSVFCYFEMLEDYPDREPTRVQIINYATLNDELPLWIIPDRGHFVLTEEGDEEKSMPPFAFAFRNESDADAVAEELDGRVLDWEELGELIKPLTDEYEPPKRRFQHTPNKYRPQED